MKIFPKVVMKSEITRQFSAYRSAAFRQYIALPIVLWAAVQQVVAAGENIASTLQFSSFTTMEASLVKALLAEATSANIIHDSSRDALGLVHHLVTNAALPIQLGGASRGSRPVKSLCCRGLNTEQGVAVLVFSNVSQTLRLVSELSLGDVTSPLLLLSLSLADDERLVLKALTKVRRLALLKLRQKRLEGPAALSLTTYMPFQTPERQFPLQVVSGSGHLRLRDVFKERFGDFNGLVLQVASWIDDFPFLYFDSDGRVQGLAKVMLDELAGRLHFTYNLQKEPPDGYWGEVVNGTWMGMAGQLVRGEKDLIVDGFAILHDRYLALDLSIPYFTDSYGAALKVPQRSVWHRN